MEPIEKVVRADGQTSKPGGEGATPGFVVVDTQTSKPGGEGATPGFLDASADANQTQENS